MKSYKQLADELCALLGRGNSLARAAEIVAKRHNKKRTGRKALPVSERGAK